MGHNPVSGTRLLIAGTKIQKTFPEKLPRRRIIDAELERRQSVSPGTGSTGKDPLTRLTLPAAASSRTFNS